MVTANVNRWGQVKESDGFFKEGKKPAAYRAELESLGAPEHIMELFDGFMIMKKISQEAQREETGEMIITRWDKKELYHFACSDACFERLQIIPDLGYVDWGFGYN